MADAEANKQPFVCLFQWQKNLQYVSETWSLSVLINTIKKYYNQSGDLHKFKVNFSSIFFIYYEIIFSTVFYFGVVLVET